MRLHHLPRVCFGGDAWDRGAYADYTKTTSHVGAGARFSAGATRARTTGRGLADGLDPAQLKDGRRESRDSTTHPESMAYTMALDVTGSMGAVINELAHTGMGKLINALYDRNPCGGSPHVMIEGVGDVDAGDRHPLQMTQFEAGPAPLITQLEDLYIEGGGGGNSCESYHLPWYAAAFHTSIDCWEKRQKKGILVTIGDEEAPSYALTPAHVRRVFGSAVAEETLTAEQLLQLAQRTHDVFHVVIEQGSHATHYPDRVRSTWTALLGQKVLFCDDHTKIAECVVAALEVYAAGRDKDAVIKSWGDAAKTVSRALALVEPARTGTGVATL